MNIKENVKQGHKERLESVKDWKRTTYVKMSEDTGISLSTLRQIAAGYLNISIKTATALVNTYSGLNLEWILTGEGTMLNDSTISHTESFDGWSAEQLSLVVKSQQERISELKQTIVIMREQIELLKETLSNKELADALKKEFTLDQTE